MVLSGSLALLIFLLLGERALARGTARLRVARTSIAGAVRTRACSGSGASVYRRGR